MRKATHGWGSLVLLLGLLLPAPAPAQAPVAGAAYQVKDINTTMASGGGSGVEFPFVVNGLVYFNAWKPTIGAELWKSDGTEAGTALVKDVFPGPGSSDPEPFASIGGTVFFSADDGGTGRELWKSDGTAAGTVPVKDVRPGSAGSEPWMLTGANGAVFFLADDGVHGRELWKSDGTPAGTVLVKDIRPGVAGGPTRLYPGPGGVLLMADDGVNGLELWKSDGTTVGTVLVKDIVAGSQGVGFSTSERPAASIGGLFYFVADDRTSGPELWRSDGTEAGTLLVKDISSSPFAAGPSDLWTAGGRVFFRYGIMASYQLWTSDGTEAGTVQLPATLPEIVGAAGPYLYVRATDATYGVELWRTDGTEAGTVLVKDIAAGDAGSHPWRGGALGSTLFFLATTDGSNWTLWRTDGTEAGTLAVKAVTGFESPIGVVAWLFFVSQDEAGSEPWRSDGTEAGTARLKDVNPESTHGDIAEPVGAGGLLVFKATDEASGTEVWKSDGTEAGTTSLDLQPGAESSWPHALAAVGDQAFFRAYDAVNDYELWESDGTAAGTALLLDIAPEPGYGSDLRNTLAVGGTLFFSAKSGEDVGQELWKSDGTQAGTVMLGDQRPGPGDLDPKGLRAAAGRVFFTGYQDGYGRELWTSDGTAGGTTLVKDVVPGDTGIQLNWLEAVGGVVFFDAPATGPGGDQAARESRKETGGGPPPGPSLGRELWKSDGTEAGTVMVRDINPGTAGSSLAWLTAVEGRLFFAADDGTHGAELWKSDGTEAGTQLVKDIYPGAGGSAPVRDPRFDREDSQEAPAAYAALGETLLFAANDGVHGLELWRSDGTEAGTVLVRDIDPGTAGSNPEHLTVHKGVLYFTASDGQNGYELWRSDGTAAGTTLVGDVAPGADSSSPQWIASTANRLYFVADDGTSGYELWAVANTADLSITKTDGEGSVASGSTVTYTITVTNEGSGTVLGTRVSDVLPASLEDAAWTCAPASSGGVATCAAAGTGDIADTVNLGPGESVVYTLEATVSGSGEVANTATVTAPGDFADPNPSNNSATDTDTITGGSGPRDFNGDGKTDLLWHHQVTGELYVWFLDGTVTTGGSYLTPRSFADTKWQIRGLGDFNKDGKLDVLWHHQVSGDLYVWFLDGTVTVGGSYLTPKTFADTKWQIRGVADFDGDGNLDLLWHHQATGELYVWFMNGLTVARGSYLTPKSFSDTQWQIRGLADFSGDGKADVLWHHQRTGDLYVWYLNGTVTTGGSYLTPKSFADTNWKIVLVADFNGDGRSDLLWHNQATGYLYAWFLDGTVTASGSYLTPNRFADTNWKIVPR